MTEKNKYIKARIKLQKEIAKVYPPAESWGKPIGPERISPSTDECIMPYLGKIVWVKKKRIDLNRFQYEIKSTGGLVILPDWIDYFDSEDLVPSAKWEDPWGERDNNDTWLDPFKKRYMVIDDILIVTG